MEPVEESPLLWALLPLLLPPVAPMVLRHVMLPLLQLHLQQQAAHEVDERALGRQVTTMMT